MGRTSPSWRRVDPVRGSAQEYDRDAFLQASTARRPTCRARRTRPSFRLPGRAGGRMAWHGVAVGHGIWAEGQGRSDSAGPTDVIARVLQLESSPRGVWLAAVLILTVVRAWIGHPGQLKPHHAKSLCILACTSPAACRASGLQTLPWQLNAVSGVTGDWRSDRTFCTRVRAGVQSTYMPPPSPATRADVDPWHGPS